MLEALLPRGADSVDAQSVQRQLELLLLRRVAALACFWPCSVSTRVSRLGKRSGRSPDWIKVKIPDAPAATRLIEGEMPRPFRHPLILHRSYTATPPHADHSAGLFIPTTKALVFFAKVLDLFRRLVQDTAVFFPRGVAFFVAGDFSSPSSTVSAIGCLSPLLRHSDSGAAR
jgi:hypothetical protein